MSASLALLLVDVGVRPSPPANVQIVDEYDRAWLTICMFSGWHFPASTSQCIVWIAREAARLERLDSTFWLDELFGSYISTRRTSYCVLLAALAFAHGSESAVDRFGELRVWLDAKLDRYKRSKP